MAWNVPQCGFNTTILKIMFTFVYSISWFDSFYYFNILNSQAILSDSHKGKQILLLCQP